MQDTIKNHVQSNNATTKPHISVLKTTVVMRKLSWTNLKRTASLPISTSSLFSDEDKQTRPSPSSRALTRCFISWLTGITLQTQPGVLCLSTSSPHSSQQPPALVQPRHLEKWCHTAECQSWQGWLFKQKPNSSKMPRSCEQKAPTAVIKPIFCASLGSTGPLGKLQLAHLWMKLHEASFINWLWSIHKWNASFYR